ncbi:MAG: hypothetical protein IT462_14655 [Planctomycetes bacterium]|nr:hypothetical protein [Planctomycetota bacterium]
MFEGFAGAALGKGLESLSKLFSKKRTALEDEQIKANASKLMAETTHLEKTAGHGDREIELAERNFAHNRYAWMCDPYRDLKAKKLDAFSEATCQLWIMPLVLVGAKVPMTPALNTQLNNLIGASLDKFTLALPYMSDEMRARYGDFIEKVSNLIQWLQTAKPASSPEALQASATEAFEKLLAEMKAWVEPIELYCRLRDDAKAKKTEAALTATNQAHSKPKTWSCGRDKQKASRPDEH